MLLEFQIGWFASTQDRGWVLVPDCAHTPDLYQALPDIDAARGGN